MSIFSKPLSQLSPSDLQELLSEQAIENRRLEFKRQIPEKDDTLKKLSSFANTFGGYVVMGAEADNSGRILDLPGVPIESGYKQKIVQWCYDSVSPPLEVAVSDPVPVPSGSGRFAYVLYVPESELTPHFLNGRKGVWVRTDEFSQRLEPRLATETELRQLLDRRKAIIERREAIATRARDRFATFTTTRYGELGKRQTGIGARLLLTIVPRYPSQSVCDQARLIDLLGAKQLPWRDGTFPNDTRTIVAQHESAIVVHPGFSFSMLEANTWGMVFYALEIERLEQGIAGIHLDHFLGHLLIFLQHASLILSETGVVGPLMILLHFEGVRGLPWMFFQYNSPKAGSSSEFDDVTSMALEITAEELTIRPDGIMMDLLSLAFFALNWADVARNRQQLRNLVRVGYGYNGVQAPDVLRE